MRYYLGGKIENKHNFAQNTVGIWVRQRLFRSVAVLQFCLYILNSEAQTLCSIWLEFFFDLYNQNFNGSKYIFKIRVYQICITAIETETKFANHNTECVRINHQLSQPCTAARSSDSGFAVAAQTTNNNTKTVCVARTQTTSDGGHCVFLLGKSELHSTRLRETR